MMTTSILQEFTNQLADFGIGLEKLHQMMSDVDEPAAPQLVEDIHAETLAIIGLQIAVLEAAKKAQLAIEQKNDLLQARRSFGLCNQSFTGMFERFYERLYTMEHIIELKKLKRKKAGDWVSITLNDLSSSHKGIQKVCNLLLACWQALAEGMTIGTPALHSTSISQQFLVPNRKS
jgi:hypothetical protein